MNQSESQSTPLLITRLENYTLQYPNEVLLIQARLDGEDDSIVVFKGFSSSLVHPTAYDPEVPVLSEKAVVYKIDRLKGPYRPDSPHYIEKDIDADSFFARLESLGL